MTTDMTTDWTSEKYFKSLFDNEKANASAQLDPAWFPGLLLCSPAFLWNFVYRPLHHRDPEFVYVPFQKRRDMPTFLKMIRPFTNGTLPGSPDIYVPVFFQINCLPNSPGSPGSRSLICTFCLTLGRDMKLTLRCITFCRSLPLKASPFPFFLRGSWPVSLAYSDWQFSILPNDFEDRLSQAFAHRIWPLLHERSEMFNFSRNDPLVILSHNLDFWLPHAYRVIEDRLREFPRCEFESTDQVGTLMRLRREIPEDT